MSLAQYTSSSDKVTRARPLLGTFVEITAQGLACIDLHHAIDQAFDAVNKAHSLMSFHDPLSDVSRLNQVASAGNVIVDAWTFEVLCCALELSNKSAGLFDITVADLLVQSKYLPNHFGQWDPIHTRATFRDIELGSSNDVQFHSPLLIDLGGIAKGFAVDQAVEALKVCGVTTGLINAGGDIRAFGSQFYPISLRHPLNHQLKAPLLQLSDKAIATSAASDLASSHFFDPIRALPICFDKSISVCASTCMMADALTKVCIVSRIAAPGLLSEYNAAGFYVDQLGNIELVNSPGNTDDIKERETQLST